MFTTATKARSFAGEDRSNFFRKLWSIWPEIRHNSSSAGEYAGSHAPRARPHDSFSSQSFVFKAVELATGSLVKVKIMTCIGQR